MQSPQTIARDIIAREGGFVNDPADPGGATKYGVTIHTMRRLGLDLNGDGDVDVGDVKAVTPDHATDIFLDHYFRRPKIDRLPESIQASVFDMYVNAGSQAVKILQRTVNACAVTSQNLVADGVVGPMTIRATEKVVSAMSALFVDAYGIARRNFYYGLADRRVQSRKYATRRDGGKGGWITRAEEFIRPKYHLSEAEHRARVAGW